MDSKIIPFKNIHCPNCGKLIASQVKPINGTIRVKCSYCKSVLTMKFENGILKETEYCDKENDFDE